MKPFIKALVIGVGIAIGLILTLSIWDSSSREESIVDKGYAKIIHDRFQIKSGAHIIGTVTNMTDETLKYVLVEGSLFDPSGTFLDKSDDYVDEIKPHGTFNFKIPFASNYRTDQDFITIRDGLTIESTNDVSFVTKVTQGYIAK